MQWYRIFCDNCGLDEYLKTDFKPNKCPKCNMVKGFMAEEEEYDVLLPDGTDRQ